VPSKHVMTKQTISPLAAGAQHTGYLSKL